MNLEQFLDLTLDPLEPKYQEEVNIEYDKAIKRMKDHAFKSKASFGKALKVKVPKHIMETSSNA